MNLKSYIYNAETPCYTSLTIKDKVEEIAFYKDKVYELPANDPFVRSLVAQKKLTIKKTEKTVK
jgi:hypothetical protein